MKWNDLRDTNIQLGATLRMFALEPAEEREQDAEFEETPDEDSAIEIEVSQEDVDNVDMSADAGVDEEIDVTDDKEVAPAEDHGDVETLVVEDAVSVSAPADEDAEEEIAEGEDKAPDTVAAEPALPMDDFYQVASVQPPNTVQREYTPVGTVPLSSIAESFGVAVDDIRKWNGLDAHITETATPVVVYLPVAAETDDADDAAPAEPTPAETVEPTDTEYTVHVVQTGDTLHNIARRYNTTTDTIIRLNDIKNPNVVVLGSELKVPALR